MNLQNLHTVFIAAQRECDSVIASSAQGVVSDSFKFEYTKKVKTIPSFSPYNAIEWLSGNAVAEFTTRSGKRIFFPTVGFFVAAKLVPLYRELLKYRYAVDAMLQANGTTIDAEEDNNGNVSQSAIQMADSFADFTAIEKDWIKKFLSEKKNSPDRWWGKGKEIKRTNDFFVSPLMKCAKLNAETQGEIADVTKQLATDSSLFLMLASGPIKAHSNTDVLSIALQEFAKLRKSDWLKQGRAVNERQRAYFAQFTAARIAALSETDVRDLFCHSEGSGADKFESMWSGKGGQGWPHIDPTGDAAKLQGERDYLGRLKANAAIAATYWTDGTTNRPAGFGPSVVTELLMKFHPEQCIKHGMVSREALAFLKLIDIPTPYKSDYSEEEYALVLGAATIILGKMKAMKLPRLIAVDGSEDGASPDYLTVNEFLYFVNEKKDLIMREWSKQMKKIVKLDNQLKDVKLKDLVEAFIKAAKDANLKYEDNLVRRFVCALMAKPFVVLTGLSGSGKTKLAEAFTEWIGAEDMVKVVPVGADWTNNEKTLGYPNALDGSRYVLSDTGILKFLLDARDNPSVPFFLVLDEMNLSHVERYFADFLSAMESGKKIHLYDGDARTSNDGIPVPSELEIPKNLFVIGTMNVDETTYMFSPKVLDRAQVIEFRVSPDEMRSFLAEPTYPKMDELRGKGAAYAEAFLARSLKRGELEIEEEAKSELQAVLNGIFPELAKLGSEFAYRCAVEVISFVACYLDASGCRDLPDDAKKNCRLNAIDAAMLQKLLPKLHGSLNRLGPAIDVMLERLSVKVPDGDGDEKTVPTYPLSYDKLVRMKDRLESNGFTSYAEA